MQLLERMYQAQKEQIKDKWRKRYVWMDENILEELAIGELYEIQQVTNPLNCNHDD